MKKIPLRMYFYGIVGLILLLLGIYQAVRLGTNMSFVSAYNRGEFKTEAESKLLKYNFPESYLPYYNLGNAAYKQGDYNAAVGHYTEALKQHPTEEKECDIRVNLALSLCNTIDFNNLTSQDKIDTALFILYKARDILLEKGCATDEGEPGHDADAQQLKEDIDRMIEQLNNPDQNNSSQDQQDQSNSSDSEENSGEDSKPSDKEKKVQKELEENKKNALEDRKDQRDTMEKWGDYIGGNPEGDEEGGYGSDYNNSPW